MRGYPVYRMNPADQSVERIGSIIELRRSRRSMNRISLAKLAQQLFSREEGEIIFLGSDTRPQEASRTADAVTSLPAG